MSAYLLGLLTVPGVLAATLGLWFLLTIVGKAFVGFTTLVLPGSDNYRRATMGGLVATANRAVMIRFGGSSAVMVVHGRRVATDRLQAAKDVLADLDLTTPTDPSREIR